MSDKLKILQSTTFLWLIFLSNVQSYEVIVDNLCNCKDVDIVSNRDIVLRKHGDVLGRYTQIEGAQGGSSTPSYMHSSGKFFLYYSSQSQVTKKINLIILKIEFQKVFDSRDSGQLGKL
jgi:hypothetical protein